MNIDFSLLLLILSAITGVIWLIDIFLLKKPRLSRVESFLQKKSLSNEEFQAYLDSLDADGSVKKDKSKKARKTTQKDIDLEHASTLLHEPVPVEYAKSFFPILFAVLILRSFLFEPFQIPTGSMIPTLNVGDFIVVNKFSYGFRLPVIGTKVIDVAEPERGDVMVFVPPHVPEYYIKRVIGLPGDFVEYLDKTIYINGVAITQSNPEFIIEENVIHSIESIGGIEHDIYTAPGPRYFRSGDWMQEGGMEIPEGHYFMMGDNRDNSSDSRVWGPVPEENIVGKAVAVWMHKEPGLHLPVFSQNRFIENP